MLPKVEFDPAKHSRVVAEFNCGDDEWAIEVSNWLKAPESDMESATRMLARKQVDKVWLYFEDDGRMIGFTSLGTDKWEREGRPPEPVLYIPYLGMSLDFQGVKEPKQKKSYVRILFEDLLYEAEKRAHVTRQLLTLHVQKTNSKAIGIYESYGFKISGEDGIYHRMVVQIGGV